MRPFKTDRETEKAMAAMFLRAAFVPGCGARLRQLQRLFAGFPCKAQGAFENGRRRKRASSGRKVARHPEEGLHKHRRCGRCRLMFQMTGFLGAQRQTKGRQRAGERQIQSLFQPCSPPPVAHFGCAHVCAPMFNIRFRTIHRLGSANSVTRRAICRTQARIFPY